MVDAVFVVMASFTPERVENPDWSEMTGKVCVKIVLTSLQPRGDRSNSAERVAPEPPDLCVFYPLSHRRTLLQTATSTRDNSTCPLTPTFSENTRICDGIRSDPIRDARLKGL